MSIIRHVGLVWIDVHDVNNSNSVHDVNTVYGLTKSTLFTLNTVFTRATGSVVGDVDTVPIVRSVYIGNNSDRAGVGCRDLYCRCAVFGSAPSPEGSAQMFTV